MDQLGLFDTPAFDRVFRESDPQTSKDAAPNAYRLNELQRYMLLAFAHGPKTANEAAEYCLSRMHPSGNTETLRKRAGELLALGRIAEVDRRKCGVTGVTARVFGVAP